MLVSKDDVRGGWVILSTDDVIDVCRREIHVVRVGNFYFRLNTIMKHIYLRGISIVQHNVVQVIPGAHKKEKGASYYCNRVL